MLFGKKKLIGLDIGTSTIKIAELDVTRRAATLVSYGMLPTPPEAVNGADLVDPHAVAAAVRQLVDEVKSKRKMVATGLWGSSVIVKRISIPRMEEKLVAEQIKWEAEQYIPFDINQVNLDYKILSSKDPSSETMNILLVAAVQESIFKCAEIIELAGLNCTVLDVVGFALANCYDRNYGVSSEAVGLLNVGACVSNFIVIENREVIFCRDIPVGGNTYTSEINKGMGISFEEAEGMKLEISSGQPSPVDVTNIIQSTHEVICDELSSSVDFFQNTSANSSLKRLYVTGGALATPGMLEQLNRIVPAERFDPFLNLKYSRKTFSDDYIDQIRDYSAVAIGLGMRTIGDA